MGFSTVLILYLNSDIYFLFEVYSFMGVPLQWKPHLSIFHIYSIVKFHNIFLSSFIIWHWNSCFCICKSTLVGWTGHLAPKIHKISKTCWTARQKLNKLLQSRYKVIYYYCKGGLMVIKIIKFLKWFIISVTIYLNKLVN